MEEVKQNSRETSEAADVAEAGMVRMTMMQQNLLNAMRLYGPQSVDLIEQRYVRITGGKPSPGFIPQMVKRGWIVHTSAGYQITMKGLDDVGAINDKDVRIAKPRNLDVMKREPYVPSELKYRGQR